MSFSQKGKIASGITFVVMLLFVIAPERSFVPSTSALYGFNWSQIFVLISIVVTFVVLFPKLKYDHSFLGYFKVAWPIIIYAIIEISFLIFGFLHRDQPGLTKTFFENWWFGYGIMLMLLPGAYFLGYIVRWDAKKQAQFLLTVFLLLTVIVFGEYLYGNGAHNPVGNFVHFLNLSTDRIWQWSPGAESLRVTALYTAPTLLAMVTLSGMVWALSANYNRPLRVFLFLDCTLILFLTASRTEFLAALILVFCSALVKIQNDGLKNWLKKSVPVLLIVALILFVGAGVYLHQFSKNYSAGLLTRLSASESNVAKSKDSQSQEAVLAKLDQLSSGRVSLWGEAFRVIEKHPFGTGMPSGCYLSRAHAHNDFLSKYITQGILGIIMIIFVLTWMTGQPDGKFSTDMGLYFAITLFAIGLMDCAFAQSPVLVLPLFLLGLNAGNTR